MWDKCYEAGAHDDYYDISEYEQQLRNQSRFDAERQSRIRHRSRLEYGSYVHHIYQQDDEELFTAPPPASETTIIVIIKDNNQEPVKFQLNEDSIRDSAVRCLFILGWLVDVAVTYGKTEIFDLIHKMGGKLRMLERLYGIVVESKPTTHKRRPFDPDHPRFDLI